MSLYTVKEAICHCSVSHYRGSNSLPRHSIIQVEEGNKICSITSYWADNLDKAAVQYSSHPLLHFGSILSRCWVENTVDFFLTELFSSVSCRKPFGWKNQINWCLLPDFCFFCKTLQMAISQLTKESNLTQSLITHLWRGLRLEHCYLYISEYFSVLSPSWSMLDEAIFWLQALVPLNFLWCSTFCVSGHFCWLSYYWAMINWVLSKQWWKTLSSQHWHS